MSRSMETKLTRPMSVDNGDCVSTLEKNLAPVTECNFADSDIVDEGAVLAVVHEIGAGIQLVDAEVDVADHAKNTLGDRVLLDRVGEVTRCLTSERDLIVDQIDWNKHKICFIRKLPTTIKKSS
jgi:hypothetical protein